MASRPLNGTTLTSFVMSTNSLGGRYRSHPVTRTVSISPSGDRHNAAEGGVALDDTARARLAAWFADANADLAERLGRPIERWTHA
jgi:hypothetical protein